MNYDGNLALTVRAILVFSMISSETSDGPGPFSSHF